jgi:hypothetical protein
MIMLASGNLRGDGRRDGSTGQKKPHPSTGLFPSSAVVTKGSPINSHEGRIRESLYREPRLIHERVER